MHQFLIIYENNKSRGFYRYLGNVVQTKSLTLIRRGLLHCHSLCHDLIQHTGSHTHGVVLADDIDGLEQLGQSLTRLRRDEQKLRIRHEGQSIAHLFRKFVNSLVVFFDSIPLIHNDDRSLASLMGNSGDLRILLRNAFFRIDHQYHDLRTLHGTDSTDDHVTLQLFLDLILTTESRSINEDIFLAVISDLGVHRVSGSTCDIGYDQTVLTQQLIDQGRLTYVRFTDDSHAGAVILLFLCLFLIKIFGYSF